MIDEIHIHDVALIHDAHFAPHANLTVITGETGTGKTALLNALKLLVGERADAGLIREGCSEMSVEGRFFFDNDEEGTVASRRVGAQGRSRVSIDGSLASVKELAQRIGTHVDLCGQHEHQHLLSTSYQRQLFDTWAGKDVMAAREDYQRAFKEVQDAQAELARLEDLANADTVELDRARFALEQIDKLDPQPGEYEELLAELPRLEHAEMLKEESAHAQRTIAGSPGVLELLDDALSSLDKVAAVDEKVEELTAQVRESYFVLEDAGRTLSTYRDQIDYSGEELEQTQDRIAALQGLMRGFGPRMEDVFEQRAQAQRRIADYEGRDELIAAAKKAADDAEARLQKAADALCRARSKAAPQFSQAVHEQLLRLEMGSSHLEVALEDLPREKWDSWGSQSCEFMYAAGTGMKLQRLSKVASGGEMSRIMLALKVVLGECDAVDTLVFDEIDAGVGGSTARSLAEVLVDLSRTHQVIVVTHLAQVAVCGDAHYVVTKTGDDLPETSLAALEGQARVEEIARMLSGEINDVSLAHARELLDERAAH